MRDLLKELINAPIGVAATTNAEALLQAETIETPDSARRKDFLTGRALARRALAELGLPTFPIARGDKGMPVWPAGAIGSITHCPGYTAAAVTLGHAVASLGIDAEPDVEVSRNLCARIALSEEREWIGGDLRRARILFSAKESVYKAWFPMTSRRLGFRDVLLHFSESGTFHAKPLVRSSLGVAVLPGRYSRQDGIIRTAAVVPRH